MVPRHLGLALLVLLSGQVSAACNKDDDERTDTGEHGSESTDTGASTGEAVTLDFPDSTGTTADLTATAADPGEAPFEAICAFYGVKRGLCFEDETSEAAELACREVIHEATLADGPLCHEAYGDLYYCKTAGACVDLDRPSCPAQSSAVAKACPQNPVL